MFLLLYLISTLSVVLVEIKRINKRVWCQGSERCQKYLCVLLISSPRALRLASEDSSKQPFESGCNHGPPQFFIETGIPVYIASVRVSTPSSTSPKRLWVAASAHDFPYKPFVTTSELKPEPNPGKEIMPPGASASSSGWNL